MNAVCIYLPVTRRFSYLNVDGLTIGGRQHMYRTEITSACMPCVSVGYSALRRESVFVRRKTHRY
jgi:hypothetical protein